MFRRKLALYTLLYIAGIAAGFFMFERSRSLEAAGFCAAVIAGIFFTDPYGTARVFPRISRVSEPVHKAKHLNEDSNSARHLSTKQEVLEKQRTVLAMMFLAGLLLFAFRSMTYSSAVSYVHDKNYIRGKVTSVTVRDSKVQLVVKNIGTGPAKVLVTLDERAAVRSYERFDSLGASLVFDAEDFKEQDLPEEYTAFEDLGPFSYIGEIIEARGEYSEIPSADDPGCFDYNLYMKSKGISLRFKAYVLEVTDARVPPSAHVRRYLYNAREAFISRFDEDTQGFIRGVIFGDKSEIGDEILEEFNNNSTGHILAVSGLHIGFLYGLLRFLTVRKRTLPVSLLIIAVILLYGEMTMWSPATVRACIVMAISLFSTHFRKCSDLLTSISAAAFLILSYQPYQLFNSGFQLSFLALCSIAFLAGPISAITGEALAVMLAVQIGTMPVIAYSYCRINPLSILINVPVILLASVLVPLCILMLMLEAAFSRVPGIGIDIAELISYAVIKINHILSFGGSFSIKTAGPGAAAMIVLYLLVFGLSSEWVRVMLLRKETKAILKQGILLLLPLTMLFSCLYDTISDDEIVFVAVGQGDCVHIREGRHDVLIDGGGQTGNTGRKEDTDNDKNSSKGNNGNKAGILKNDNGYNVGKEILMPYLMHSGADNVDIALVTHLHTDHYKGIAELSDVFPVGAIGIPSDYKDSYADKIADHDHVADPDTEDNQKNILSRHDQPMRVILIKPGTKVDVTDDVYIKAIWPVTESDEPLAADDPNEHNTVYMVNYKGIKIMVTGDLLEADEHEMVDYYKGTDELECDILKVAHHGSKSSSSEEFLDAAKPRIAVIQCGRNNFYGHPHQQTLERLEKRKIKIFRTDLSGAVGIDIHGSRLSVDLFKGAD